MLFDKFVGRVGSWLKRAGRYESVATRSGGPDRDTPGENGRMGQSVLLRAVPRQGAGEPTSIMRMSLLSARVTPLLSRLLRPTPNEPRMKTGRVDPFARISPRADVWKAPPLRGWPASINESQS